MEHTGECFVHVVDEQVDEADLRLWNVAALTVEDRHDDRQTARLLLVRLWVIRDTSTGCNPMSERARCISQHRRLNVHLGGRTATVVLT